MSAAKDRLKGAVKGALAAVGRERPPGEGASRILTYHSVGYRDHEMNVLPEAFAEQMAWLSDTHRVVPVCEALTTPGTVALTFDDGYRDNFTVAWPTLSRLELPATVYVVTDRLGGWLEHDRSDESACLMSWDDARELHRAGMAIGAHTRTHARLSGLDPARQEEEILGSIQRVEAELGAPVAGFAFPYGSIFDYNAASLGILGQSSARYAVSNRYGTVSQSDGPWAYRRIWIDRTDTLATFRAKVSGRLDGLRAFDSAAGMALRRALNAALRG